MWYEKEGKASKESFEEPKPKNHRNKKEVGHHQLLLLRLFPNLDTSTEYSLQLF
jgi:hypothetical protein